MQRREAIRRYFERRQLYPFQLATKPSGDPHLFVVIPCFDEPDIDRVMDSLARCADPGCEVEIIVVVNGPMNMRDSARGRNARAAERLAAWECKNGAGLPAWMRIFCIRHEDLPARQAGVGVARKIGMDEAVFRSCGTRSADGVIISVDADCVVAKNYLYEINKAFSEYPRCPGMSIHYEHDLHNSQSVVLREAITEYELHLRCHVTGQRVARFPYAFHTIGSAMAFRASSYVAQGGMNLRQGGEDFYFIQKLVALGGYRTLTSTVVFPAARLSHRVPFGTGPAIKHRLDTGVPLETYATEIYRELEIFCTQLRDLSPDRFVDQQGSLPGTLQCFLQQQGFAERLQEIRSNVASSQNFRKRVFRWFNAFRFLKFAQFASRKDHPRIPVVLAARQIAESADISSLPDSANSSEWLRIYRQFERRSARESWQH